MQQTELLNIAFGCGIIGTVSLALLQYPLFKLLAFSDSIMSDAYSYYYIRFAFRTRSPQFHGSFASLLMLLVNSLIGMPFAIFNMGLIGILQGLDRLWIIMLSTFANYGVQLIANLLGCFGILKP